MICTCTARAQCTTAPYFIRRKVGIAKVHQSAEFVKTASSPLAHAAGTPLKRHPQWILSWCSTRVTCEFRICGAHRLTCGGGKKLQVQIICTCTTRAQCTPAPFYIRRQVGLVKVYPCTEFGVPSSKFLKPKDPSSKRFSAPGACSWHPTETASPMDFKLVQYACDLRVSDLWCPPCDL